MTPFETGVCVVLGSILFGLIFLMAAIVRVLINTSSWPKVIKSAARQLSALRIIRDGCVGDALLWLMHDSRINEKLRGFLAITYEERTTGKTLKQSLRTATARISEGERKLLALFKNSVGWGLLGGTLGAAIITRNLADGGFDPKTLSSALWVTMAGLGLGLLSAHVDYFLDWALRRQAMKLHAPIERLEMAFENQPRQNP